MGRSSADRRARDIPRPVHLLGARHLPRDVRHRVLELEGGTWARPVPQLSDGPPHRRGRTVNATPTRGVRARTRLSGLAAMALLIAPGAVVATSRGSSSDAPREPAAPATTT